MDYLIALSLVGLFDHICLL